MSDLRHRNHFDLTNTVFVADPPAVCDAITAILNDTYPGADPAPIERACNLFSRLYTGELEGYVGCETWYHDAQHSLEVALAMARLLAANEQAEDADTRLGEHRFVIGVVAALFHDAGYIRHVDDPQRHGAELTPCHVRRGGEFLAQRLPDLGLAEGVSVIGQLLHFTGYELALDDIDISDPRDRRLGFILGSADLLAQISDRCYLEKCRDCLYPEFEICGMAGPPRPGAAEPVFASPEELMRGTPDFIDQVWAQRLDGFFGGVHRLESIFFDGRTPYADAIRAQRPRLESALAENRIRDGLRRRVECVNAGPLRALMGLPLAGWRNDPRPPRPGSAAT